MLGWHIESVVRGGLAGTFFTHGRTNGGVTDRTSLIGLSDSLRRDRMPKQALDTVKALFNERRVDDSQGQAATLSKGFRHCLLL